MTPETLKSPKEWWKEVEQAIIDVPHMGPIDLLCGQGALKLIHDAEVVTEVYPRVYMGSVGEKTFSVHHLPTLDSLMIEVRKYGYLPLTSYMVIGMMGATKVFELKLEI